MKLRNVIISFFKFKYLLFSKNMVFIFQDFCKFEFQMSNFLTENGFQHREVQIFRSSYLINFDVKKSWNLLKLRQNEALNDGICYTN